jgi:hypothetical protein
MRSQEPLPARVFPETARISFFKGVVYGTHDHRFISLPTFGGPSADPDFSRRN